MAGLDDIAPDVDIQAEMEADTADVQAVETPSAPEPVVEEIEAAPAPVATEAPKPNKPPPGYVPLGALHEARERNQRITADYEAKIAAIEARLEAINNPPPKVPTFDEDPANNLRMELDRTRQEMEPVKQQLQGYHEATQRQQAEQRLTQEVGNAEAEFAKANPDYLDAVTHFQNVSRNNLQLLGMTDQAAINEQLRTDAIRLSVQALRMGKSPAEVVYALAKNAGYAKAAPNAGGAATLSNIEKGQKATPSMPGGGQKATGDFSIADIDSMNDDEIDKLINDNDSWRKLLRTG